MVRKEKQENMQEARKEKREQRRKVLREIWKRRRTGELKKGSFTKKKR